MHIYKITNLINNKVYVGQTIQKKAIMKEVNKQTSGGKTWKVIDGKRVWLDKEASV